MAEKYMYLQLFHGRKFGEQLDDWGKQGPIFGPLQWGHTTYATDIKFMLADNGDGDTDGEFQIVEGLVYYDGLYYGDWSFFTATESEINYEDEYRDDRNLRRHREFVPSKAQVPERDLQEIRSDRR